MNNLDNDDDRFRPARLPVRVVASAVEAILREGDNGVGRPVVVAPLDPLTAKDHRAIVAEARAEAAQAEAEAEELLAGDPAAFGWLSWFAGPLAGALLLGGFGVLGLFLYSQVLTILANIAVQPPWAQIAGYVGLGILAAAVLFAMLRFGLLYAKLRRNKQLRLAGLEELQARTRLRHLAAGKIDEARTLLTAYVTTFPMTTERDRKRLRKVGFTDEASAKLKLAQRDLTDAAALGSSVEWFEQFRSRFQTELDAVAEERIRYWANRAMLVTAASPNNLVDSVATLYFSFALLQDLCVVYNLRAGRTGTAVLLGRVFFNAYLAGQMNDLEGLIEQQADHAFDQAFQMVGIGVSSGIAGKFLGKVGAKATTGYLNRLLLMRLGRYSCRLLRPTK